ADEARRVAEERARAEAETRRVAEEKAKADEARRVAEERARADEKAKAEDAQRAASMEADREAEAERIADALRQARAARFPERVSIEQETARVASSPVEERSIRLDRGAFSPADAGRRGADDLRHATRVTVLLRLEPGTYGIRRNNKTADPLLCGEQGCYVSAGAEEAADLLRRRRALGVGGTLGRRAGACNNSLGCVFRGVELGAYPAIVQPVDMHVIKHDRRQPQVLHETSDCEASGGRLSCRQSYRGPDYVMWIVPEQVAEAAGSAALERAVEDGLAEVR
ncbi:MAG: hypothetical protein SFW09_04605, partial [Hyphomicrobiaceae bacterium]|nr:hypothetical protein [Hyphomicrobiaceae bacterium]